MDTPPIAALGPRQRHLLTILLEAKTAFTVDELAEQLAITRSAVHQHLSALEQGGYVQKEVQSPKGGRPGYAWRLTEVGIHLFPKQYALFSNALIRVMKEQLGSTGLADTLRSLGESLAAQFVHRLANKKPDEKVKEVARIMRELGYQSQTDDDPNHELPIIDARNCVYHHLAREHVEVCQLDLALLERLLNAKVDHAECMLRGGKACRFSVRSNP
ncbi:MAG: HTH domain-containing protein [Nitrococcus mobilis]|nr:HTH domain-containing protein [Nitrococcus mobilis]